MTTAAKKSPNPATVQLREHSSQAGSTLTVDREKGVIKGVKVLGLESKNGWTYTPDAVRNSIGLYEGVAVNVNHPQGKATTPRAYQDRLGTLRNVMQRADGLYGDLHYNPEHAVAKQLAWDAEHDTKNVGLSHNSTGRRVQRNGKTIVESIVAVHSVDLVNGPATTNSLFEADMSTGMDATGGMDAAGAGSGDPVKDAFLAKAGEIFDGSLDPAAKAKAIGSLAKELLKVQDAIDNAGADKAEGDKGGDKPAETTEQKLLAALTRIEAFELREQQARDAAAKRTKIDAAIVESKLPRHVVTDLFVQSLMEAKDDAAIKALIEDRKSIIGNAPASTFSRPQSRDQQQLQEAAGAGGGSIGSGNPRRWGN